MHVIKTTQCAVNVEEVSDHQVTDLKIVTAGGIVQTQHGLVITIFHQYDHLGTGKTIHLSIQLNSFGLEVDEKPIWVLGGLQCIKKLDLFHPMENKLFGHPIPGTITKTGNGDILEKSVGINDGLGRFGSIFLKFLVNTLGIKGTLVFLNDSLPFIRLEDMDKDSIHIVLLLSK